MIERPSVYHELSRISAPTLVMVGEEDTATVPAPRAPHYALGAAPRNSSIKTREFSL